VAKNVVLGTAPDSWGIWFADDLNQTPAARFLDEVVQAGYEWIEIGAFGYLPTDPSQLRDELSARRLKVSGGTTFARLQHPDTIEDVWKQIAPIASLTAAMGAEHLVVIPDFWRDPDTGDVLEPSELTDQQWPAYAAQINRLAQAIRDDYGLRFQFHPHADSHVDTHANVERFLQETDPSLVSLCLDTGHISYCGGDNLRLIRDYPERIGYVHLKQVDPAVVEKVHADGIGFGEAVRMGAMCEPPRGVPDLGPILDALAGLDAELFAIVEQDMYPCPPDQPLPIATRTLAYLRTCGPLQ
jgi:inosose dehydratase